MIYHCNNGAAVLDEDYSDMGMRGGIHRGYQFVIRDKGVIDHFIKSQAFSTMSLERGGSELIIRFVDITTGLDSQPKISEKGTLESTLIDGRGEYLKYDYKLELNGHRIKVSGIGPWGHEANWDFEDCKSVGEDK
jgi:hypothetical protein